MNPTTPTPTPTPTPTSAPEPNPAITNPDPTPPVQPVVSPVAATTEPVKQPTNPGLIVLQWLTYAFWGWTVLALSALAASVVTSIIDSSDTAGFTTYGIAAVLVLLPISYVCDSFYSKKEPGSKEGAAIWVMVIHAVLFALFGIGSLICAVVAAVFLFTSSSESTTTQITLLSSLIIAGFYALTFLRTLNPGLARWIQKSYKFIMLGLVGIIALLGIIGPVATERTTRDDRLISSELSSLTQEISNYARKNDKLPTSLSSLDVQGDAKSLVSRNLVEYKPEGSAYSASATSYTDTTYSNSTDDQATYKYQLCVHYKKEAKSKYGSSYNNEDANGYSDYIDTDSHDAGAVCYKVKTTTY